MHELLKEHFNEGWVEILSPFLLSPKFETMIKMLLFHYEHSKVLPEKKKVFRIFREIEPEDVRVIIIGQDPYKKPGEATGIAMGNENLPYITPTLANMFAEIERDFHYYPKDKTLLSWVEQGVMLTNTALTVEQGKSDSHIYIWESFTESFFINYGKFKQGIVYVLLGNYAKRCLQYIDPFSNTILTSVHPAVDSYSNKKLFYGSGLFSKINSHLNSKIIW